MSLHKPLQQSGGPSACRDIVVSTGLGQLRGIESEGLKIFRGIPYAKAPTGALRFMPPQAMEPWTGVVDARFFGPVSFQPYDASVGHDAQDMSEDCLSLNIWAPQEPGPYPVLVWIHGGGQTIGSPRRMAYEGSHFARKGCVCVTVGYRLGALGFLELGELLGPTYQGSGNNAIRDLLMALQWVQAHIAAFGGDPSRVTLGGESAGAKNAVTLSGIPSARGLFHRLVSCSGGAQTLHTLEDAQAVARLVCGVAGLPRDQAHRLLELPVSDLLAAQEGAMPQWDRRFAFRPVVDGSFFPAPVLAQLSTGACAALPSLMGFTRDECAEHSPSLFVDSIPQSRTLSHVSSEVFMGVEQRYAALWPGLSASERRARALTAQEYGIPTIRLAQAISERSAPVWVYRFDGLRGLEGEVVAAHHVADLPLWWGHPLSTLKEQDGEAAKVAAAMHQALVDFVCGRDLSANDQKVAWPSYAASARAVRCLGSDMAVQWDPEPVERALWRDVL